MVLHHNVYGTRGIETFPPREHELVRDHGCEFWRDHGREFSLEIWQELVPRYELKYVMVSGTIAYTNTPNR